MLAYIAFLRHVNDVQNIRALFEQLMQSTRGDEAADVWREYHAFEAVHGNLASLTALEQRHGALVSSREHGSSASDSVAALVERYRYGNLWPCSSAELASFVGDEHLREQPKKPKTDDRRRSAHGATLLSVSV